MESNGPNPYIDLHHLPAISSSNKLHLSFLPKFPHSSKLFIVQNFFKMEMHDDNNIKIHIKFFILLIVFSSATVSHAAPSTSTTATDNPTAVQLVTQALFRRFSNFSALFSGDILKELGYCISNV